MSKSIYLVRIARKGYEEDFHALCELGKEFNVAGQALSAELVGFMEQVRASNRREAMVLARARYPGHHVSTRIDKKVAARRSSRAESATSSCTCVYLWPQTPARPNP